MSISTRSILRCLWGFATGAAVVLALSVGLQQAVGASNMQAAPTVTVDGKVALHSLMSLGDGHLKKLADAFSILATMDSVQSGKWQQVRKPLADAARVNVPGLYWFALPNGSYWTVETGRAKGNLSGRAYFPRVLAGETIIGDLVVSKATGKSTAIVAVPVYGQGHKVVGVLGASVYLDKLSKQIEKEMAVPPGYIFYSLDKTPIVGLNIDPHVIFLHPLKVKDPQLTKAVREMLSRDSGTVSYRFHGKMRTVYYQKSPVTGWWYAFGKVQE